MIGRFLCLFGFHGKWIGVKPTTADVIRGHLMARMKCYRCKEWHSDHDVSLPEIDKKVEDMARELVIL